MKRPQNQTRVEQSSVPTPDAGTSPSIATAKLSAGRRKGNLPTAAAGDRILGNSDVLVSQWSNELQGLDVSGFNLLIRIRRLAMLQDERLAKRAGTFGVKLNEALLLLALRRVGPGYCLRPTDILKMHSVTSGTVTYRIDQLTNQDLAERIPDPVDRRGYLVRLTDRGMAIADSIIKDSSTFAATVLSSAKLRGEAQYALIELLRHFETAFETDLLSDAK